MSRFLEHTARRRGVVLSAIGGFLIAAAALAGCARDHETVQAATKNAPIGVETSQLFVTIENKAGAPLTNLEVAIVAIGAQRFTKRLERLEDGERQDVSLSDFSGADGTSFNLRFNRPKNVEVKATDVANKKYDVVVPWQ